MCTCEEVDEEVRRRFGDGELDISEHKRMPKMQFNH